LVSDFKTIFAAQKWIYNNRKKLEAGKKVGRQKTDSSPVMVEIVCARLPTLSSKHLSENNEDFVIEKITKNVDTNNVCSG